MYKCAHNVSESHNTNSNPLLTTTSVAMKNNLQIK